MFKKKYKKKLERAEYFLDNLKTFTEEAGGFAYIPSDKQQAMRANIDGFFFELISAKDFFLQDINDHYDLGLRKQDATSIDQVKNCLRCKNEKKALEVILSVEKEIISTKNTWQWQLNHYRNTATHRELLPFGYEVKWNYITSNKELFDKMKRGEVVIKPIIKGQEKEIPPDIPRVDIPRENISIHLFKDPEDPKKGNLKIEVLPYCEESLKNMKEWLESLYSQLGIPENEPQEG